MPQKHLHELLQEDQEPFHLKSYIAHKRCLIKTSTHLHLKKPKPNSAFPTSFCKKACFLSFTHSPDLGKSPLFQPATTSPLILDASFRTPNNNNNNNNASTKIKNSAKFGLFGSILNKLKQKSKTEKSSVKDMLKWDSFVSKKSFRNNAKSYGHIMEGSSSSHSVSDFDCFENGFFESPFRFVLQRSPSRGIRTPEFSSPAASPRPLYGKQEKESFENVKNLKKFREEEEEEHEDKDQFSPVSVLDPPFQDYEEEDEGYDSYENVQRAKQQLLQKLHRFEKLAELDPIELEKRILEQEYDDSYGNETNDLEGVNEFELSEQIKDGAEFFTDVCWGTNLFQQHYIPKDMKRLILDLIAEEDQIQSGIMAREAGLRKVNQRFESWKEVKYNTIDMMLEQDLKRDHDWKNHRNQVGETASEIELAIFEILVEELTKELMH